MLTIIDQFTRECLTLVADIDSLAALTNVVVFTGTDRAEDVIEAFRMGAHGIVQKTASVDTLVEAIKRVAAGMIWIPSELQRKLHAQRKDQGHEQLTKRETDIARHVAKGLINAQVAQLLSITEGTVKIHLNISFNNSVFGIAYN